MMKNQNQKQQVKMLLPTLYFMGHGICEYNLLEMPSKDIPFWVELNTNLAYWMG